MTRLHQRSENRKLFGLLRVIHINVHAFCSVSIVHLNKMFKRRYRIYTSRAYLHVACVFTRRVRIYTYPVVFTLIAYLYADAIVPKDSLEICCKRASIKRAPFISFVSLLSRCHTLTKFELSQLQKNKKLFRKHQSEGRPITISTPLIYCPILSHLSETPLYWGFMP